MRRPGSVVFVGRKGMHHGDGGVLEWHSEVRPKDEGAQNFVV